MVKKPDLDTATALMLRKVKRDMVADLNSLPKHQPDEEGPMIDLSRVIGDYLAKFPNDGKQFIIGYLAALRVTAAIQLDNTQRDKLALTLINILQKREK
jgi:hypothetical protein